MKKLYNLKMKEGAPVAEHLNAFNIITDHLVYVKIILDVQFIEILLMCSMPDSGENLIAAMSTSATAGTLKFDDVSSSLMNEELRRKLIAENEGGGRQGRSRSRGQSKSRRGKIICFHCGKLGHMKKECRFQKKGQKD